MTTSWKGKRVVILGLGQYPHGSGMAAALFFARAKADVLVSDFYYTPAMDRNITRLKRFKNVQFIFQKHPLKEIRTAALVVKHQRIRRSEPEVAEALAAEIPMETAESLFLKSCPCPIVGITGTRGKSTTTTLVADMLKASGRKVWLGGNNLFSPLEFLGKVRAEDIAVLELSSFQLEGTGAAGISPHVACITNLMRDHQNAYSGMDEYAEAKAQIFRHQENCDSLILNADDQLCRLWADQAPGSIRLFGKRHSAKTQAWLDGERLMISEAGKEIVLANAAKLSVFGIHNASNMLAAALTARTAGATFAGIRKAMRDFKGLPGRQEVIAVKNGVTYINDTTATTPDGAMAALEALRHRFTCLHFIIGGADKNLEFESLAQRLKATRANIVVLPGSAHDKLAAALHFAGVRFRDVAGLAEGVRLLREQAQKGSVVVLSPGCASFGQFQNEFDRGAAFQKLVR